MREDVTRCVPAVNRSSSTQCTNKIVTSEWPLAQSSAVSYSQAKESLSASKSTHFYFVSSEWFTRAYSECLEPSISTINRRSVGLKEVGAWADAAGSEVEVIGGCASGCPLEDVALMVLEEPMETDGVAGAEAEYRGAATGTTRVRERTRGVEQRRCFREKIGTVDRLPNNTRAGQGLGKHKRLGVEKEEEKSELIT